MVFFILILIRLITMHRNNNHSFVSLYFCCNIIVLQIKPLWNKWVLRHIVLHSLWAIINKSSNTKRTDAVWHKLWTFYVFDQQRCVTQSRVRCFQATTIEPNDGISRTRKTFSIEPNDAISRGHKTFSIKPNDGISRKNRMTLSCIRHFQSNLRSVSRVRHFQSNLWTVSRNKNFRPIFCCPEESSIDGLEVIKRSHTKKINRLLFNI